MGVLLLTLLGVLSFTLLGILTVALLGGFTLFGADGLGGGHTFDGADQGATIAQQTVYGVGHGEHPAVAGAGEALMDGLHHFGDALAAVAHLHHRLIGRAAPDDVQGNIDAHGGGLAHIVQKGVQALLRRGFPHQQMVHMGEENLLLVRQLVGPVDGGGDGAPLGAHPPGPAAGGLRRGRHGHLHPALLPVDPHGLHHHQLLNLPVVGVDAAAAAEGRERTYYNKKRKETFHFCRLLSGVFRLGSRYLFMGFGSRISSRSSGRGRPSVMGAV